MKPNSCLRSNELRSKRFAQWLHINSLAAHPKRSRAETLAAVSEIILAGNHRAASDRELKRSCVADKIDLYQALAAYAPDAAREQERTGATSDNQCRSTSIEWGVWEGAEERQLASCERVIFAELSRERDVAVFVADHAPKAQLSLDVCHARGPGERISLLGDPERGLLHWSRYCMLESLPDLGKGQVAHVCDTLPGSSGAPLLDADGQVVAVHSGSATPWNQATLLFTTSALVESLGLECGCD